MDRKSRKHQLRRQRYDGQRMLALCLALCLILSNLNFGSMLAYATEGNKKSFDIGGDVKAVLKDGVLTVRGYGDTRDFTGDTAPFSEYADEIHALVIEDGITYIGDYLFYGLGGLQGELILPESIVGIGDYAFSGESLDRAPGFTVIRNEFEGGEITEWKKAEPEESEPVQPATPSQAEEKDQPDQKESDPSAKEELDQTTNKEPDQEEPDQTAADKPDQEEPDRTAADKPDQEETDQTTKGETKKEESKKAETRKEEPDQEKTGQEEPDQTERDQTEPDQTEPEKLFSVTARIENYQVPRVGEGMAEENPDISGGGDSSEGKSDSGIENVDTNGGSSDAAGENAGTSDGTPDNSGENTDTGKGNSDTGGDNSEDNSKDNSGDNSEDNSEDNTEDNSEDNSGSSDTAPDLPGDDSSQNSSGKEQDNGSSKDDSSGNETNSTAGDITGTSEDDTVNPDTGNPDKEDGQTQDFPSGIEAGKEDKGSNTKKDSNTHKDKDPDYDIEYISQQKIENPETIFYEGQTGMVICSPDNDTFIEAAECAGYLMADSYITVALDDVAEMELPAREGQICLPECPEEITSPWDDNALFSTEFAGWTLAPGTGPEEALAPGAYMDVGEDVYLSLYSAWKAIGTCQLGVKADREGERAVYTLINKDTEEAVKSLDGYAFLYQWQCSEQDGDIREDGGWEDITGADSPVYERLVEAGDITKRFRCAVTPLQLARTFGAENPDTLYSEPANGVAVLETVYVDQTNGNDSNPGIESAPVKTIEAAAAKLKPADEGGTADNNQIILLQNYDYDAVSHFLKDVPVPVTIKGTTKNTKFFSTTATATSEFYLYEDIAFESLILGDMGHIYGNGYSILIGDDVTCNGLYLYGASKDGTLTVKPGRIEVRSGRFNRIIGYIRSKTSFDANDNEAVITVDGTAVVSSIVAGSASGEIKNGNVSVNIKGGTVAKLIGGCQGYTTVKAPYSGNTTINISGGSVTDVYGAGSGRNTAIPTYQGKLDIHVTGGNVANIYGSGSAAYVVSGGEPSVVNIEVSGGTVGNIYAAGIGGDSEVSGGNEENGTPASEFGSLTGQANITIDNDAVITGSIYASGKGYIDKEYGKENAYLNGEANITVCGGTIRGNIYGGGQGVSKTGYETCARVCEDTKVAVEIKDGVVEGYIYGGGKTAQVRGSTKVMINGGTVKGNVYGGGEEGLTYGRTAVHMTNGTVNGSIYGGALGKTDDRFVYGGSTVNMEGGWVRGNIYGGSELSNDGKSGVQDETSAAGLVFVNLTGGTVTGKVFGGGFQGIVNGSTHVHIGSGAVDKCNYYKSHADEKPVLGASDLVVGGSVYAGGDYGGDGADLDYDTITVNGFSHIYIDGTGYGFNGAGAGKMEIGGGVFGSGASCDAGDVRLVTLDHFGTAAPETGQPEQVSGAVTSIQRADQVRLIQSHVRLAGQSDVANSNQTALYSLNRIGDKGNFENLGKLGNSLVLEDGSTLVLDSASNGVANLKSMDQTEDHAVTKDTLADIPNTVVLATGTVFRISSTAQDGSEEYGAVTGYFYMIAGDTAEAYAFARVKTSDLNPSDGGFVVPGEDMELGYTNIGTLYRYWKVAGENASATRHVVLTARNLGDAGQGEDGFAVAEGTIELPPIDDAQDSRYVISEITLSDKLALVDAGLDQETGTWITSGVDIDETQEKERIQNTPATTFGLMMRQELGDGDVMSRVISDKTALKNGSNSVIGKDWDYTAPVQDSTGIPKIEFNLTYYNDGIRVSQNLGTVTVVVERYAGNNLMEVVTLNVEIVTRASALSEQTVDLYATESGSYTGRMVIPADSSRSLSLAGIKVPESGIALKAVKADLEGYDVAITLQPVQSQGWNTANLMSEPYDLYTYDKSLGAVSLGTTDSRYEAPMDFVLYNNGDFTPKDTDAIILTLTDGDGNQVPVTLNIHWKESIVSAIGMAPGKQYNGMMDTGPVVISRESSVTAAFTLQNQDSVIGASGVWLELQNGDGSKHELPAGTKLTLLSGSQCYLYTVMGTEQDGKIPLNHFTQMWESNKFTENVASKTITVIVSFDGTSGLKPDEYSLRLRNDTGADSKGGDFTVNNSMAAITLGSQGGFSRGEHSISISVSVQQDARLSDKTAVVLSSQAGKEFPKGTVFIYGDKNYYPINGNVYLILNENQDQTVIMDTTHTTGLSLEGNRMEAQLFAVGINAGKSLISSTGVSYEVKADPVYNLSVEADEKEGRVAAPGTVIPFTVSYLMEYVEQPTKIQVEVRKKENGTYIGVEGWEIKGNTKIDPGENQMTEDNASVTIAVPQNAQDGTYRLIFILGDQSALYNIIVQK